MNDLDKSKNRLYGEDSSLVIVKNGEILFETGSHGISGFLYAIEQLGARLAGASIADRVAGKAIALLCVYAGIRQVYAEVMSKNAKVIFEKSGIFYEWKELVNNILDLNRNRICPFEKATTDISDPEVAHAEFEKLLQSLKACK
jgi:hypothetical protein